MEEVAVDIVEAVEEVLVDVVEVNEAVNVLINELIAKDMREEWVAPYNYIGKAPRESWINAAVWTIYRIEVFGDGTTAVTSATGVKWTERFLINYL